MPTLISSSKTENRSSKGNKNASSQGGTATLSSSTAQLFSDGFFDEENKQDNGSFAIKSKSSFGNTDIPNNNTAGVKQLKSSPTFPAIQLKSTNQQPVQRVANTSQPVQLNSWWNRNAPSWLGGSPEDERLGKLGSSLKSGAETVGGGLKTGAKGIGGVLGGAVGAGLGAVGGGIVGAGMGAYQGATGAYSEAKKNAGGGIMGTIAGLGAGLMGGIGGLFSGGAVGAAGGLGYGAVAGAQLGSGNADKAGNTMISGMIGGGRVLGGINEGGKGFSQGAGKVVKGLGTVGGGIIGAGLGGVVGTFAGAGVGASSAYENANKAAGGGFRGGVAGAAAGLLGGIAGLGAGAVGGAALGAHELGKAAFNTDPSKPKAEGDGKMGAVERYIHNNRISTASQVASVGVNTAKYAEQGLKASDFTREAMAAASGTVTTAAKISGIGGAALGGFTAVKGMVDIGRGQHKINKNTDLLGTKDRGKDLETMNERVKLRQKIEEGKDMRRGGIYDTISGGLSTAAGVATATGLGAPIGLGLGLASMAVSGAGAIHGYAEQNGRDKKARRMRSIDEIKSDKIERNQAREEKIGGSIFNPLNWKAKFERATGLGDTDDKKIGTKGVDSKESSALLDSYALNKRKDYEKEGYNYSNFDGKGEDDISRSISKTEVSEKRNLNTNDSWKPWNWGIDKKTVSVENKIIDSEDIMFNKSMHSKEVTKRKEEEIKGREKWWHWGKKKGEKKEEIEG